VATTGRRALLRLGVRAATVAAASAVAPMMLRSAARPVPPASVTAAMAPPVAVPADAVTTPPAPRPPAATPLGTMAASTPPASATTVSLQPASAFAPGARTIARVATAGPHVALTVDDGWSRRAEIMRLLAELHVPATFFLTAQAVARDEAFVASAVANGFEVGNHSTTHRNLAMLSGTDIEAELSGMERLYERAVGAGRPMRFFRAPFGTLSEAVLDAADARSYRTIQWDVSTVDWTTTDTAGITRSVVANARPGSIILSHFNARCLEAFPAIVAGVRARGIEFVPLAQLVADVPVPRPAIAR